MQGVIRFLTHVQPVEHVVAHLDPAHPQALQIGNDRLVHRHHQVCISERGCFDMFIEAVMARLRRAQIGLGKPPHRVDIRIDVQANYIGDTQFLLDAAGEISIPVRAMATHQRRTNEASDFNATLGPAAQTHPHEKLRALSD